MADYEDDAPANTNGMGKTLNNFRSLYPQGGDAGDWAEHVSQTINDYVQTRKIAAANQAAGEAFQSNLSRFGQGLLGLVSQDPTAVDTALRLVRPTIATMVQNVPGHPEELAGQHYEEISRDLEGSLVETAVRTAALKDAGVARSILDSKADLLPEGGATNLGAYIETQQNARHLDNAVQQVQAARGQQMQETDTALNYLHTLSPPNGQPVFPPAWPQTVLNDPAVGPRASADLIDTFGRLAEKGDAPQTNPFVAARMIEDMSHGTDTGSGIGLGDIVRRAGTDLRLQDALTLAHLGQPEQNGRLDQVRSAIAQAERQLAAPENGPAGAAAFGRFINWFLPAVSNGATLDPEHPEYLLTPNRMQAFAPRVSDNVPRPVGQRRPLGEIFSG